MHNYLFYILKKDKEVGNSEGILKFNVFASSPFYIQRNPSTANVALNYQIIEECKILHITSAVVSKLVPHLLHHLCALSVLVFTGR